jgi:hypothetical protein
MSPSASPDPQSFTPAQEQVIDAASSGATFSEAAAGAGVHRNTIGYSRKPSPAFRDGFHTAQYEFTMMVRDRAVTLAADALDFMQLLLTNAKASCSFRLKAALYIVHVATTAVHPSESAA